MEKGVPVVDKQANMTPFQRQVLVQEFTRQNEEEQAMIDAEKGGNSSPRHVSGGNRNQRHSSANSKGEAIKESQEDQERYVNTSVVDNDK